MKSSFLENGGSYRQVGDYQIPNLRLSPQEEKIHLGRWGMAHLNFLKNHKRVTFAILLSEGRLYQHCAKIEKQADDMFSRLVIELAEKECITEALKESDQMEWVRRMNNIHNRAGEIVNEELIFV